MFVLINSIAVLCSFLLPSLRCGEKYERSFLCSVLSLVVFPIDAYNVRCKSSETNVEIACDLTEHGRNSIVFLSDRAESLD